MKVFVDPEMAKTYIRGLMSDALIAWGDALPVRFNETRDLWDFEVAMAPEDCDENGCVLASAFFPDGGRHQLFLYPAMFRQSKKEQVETCVHEFGHVFGLRHFFANISETAWPSVIFGKHTRFSIMNYGPDSRLTRADKADLKRLYQAAWTGELAEINGTEISLERPYSALHSPAVPSPVLLLGDGLAASAPAAPRSAYRVQNTGAD